VEWLRPDVIGVRIIAPVDGITSAMGTLALAFPTYKQSIAQNEVIVNANDEA
jgi:hypothetical protein